MNPPCIKLYILEFIIMMMMIINRSEFILKSQMHYVDFTKSPAKSLHIHHCGFMQYVVDWKAIEHTQRVQSEGISSIM